MVDRDSGPYSANELVDRLAKECIGFHFSSEKAFGKTTYAFLLQNNPHAAPINDSIKQNIRQSVCDLRGEIAASTGDMFLRELQKHTQASVTRFSLAPKSSFLPLKPFVVLVKGSMANSIATPCAVRGIYKKTVAFFQIDADLIGQILSLTARTGYTIKRGTAAHALQNESIRRRLAQQPTFESFFGCTGFWKHQAMATAYLNAWVAYVTLKEGYSDAGRQFRDLTSRKLAKAAFDDAMFYLLYSVQA